MKKIIAYSLIFITTSLHAQLKSELGVMGGPNLVFGYTQDLENYLDYPQPQHDLPMQAYTFGVHYQLTGKGHFGLVAEALFDRHLERSYLDGTEASYPFRPGRIEMTKQFDLLNFPFLVRYMPFARHRFYLEAGASAMFVASYSSFRQGSKRQGTVPKDDMSVIAGIGFEQPVGKKISVFAEARYARASIRRSIAYASLGVVFRLGEQDHKSTDSTSQKHERIARFRIFLSPAVTFRRGSSENTNYLHFFDGEWGYNFGYETKNERAGVGYNAGIGGEFRLGSRLSAEIDVMADVARISTTSSFTMHYVSYDYPQNKYRDIEGYHLSYRYTFAALPVCLLYRLKDNRAYFGLGIQPAILMSYSQWDNQKGWPDSGAVNAKEGIHAEQSQGYLFWTVKAGLEGPELNGSRGRLFLEPYFSMQIGDTRPFVESTKTLPSKQLWSAGVRVGLKI